MKIITILHDLFLTEKIHKHFKYTSLFMFPDHNSTSMRMKIMTKVTTKDTMGIASTHNTPQGLEEINWPITRSCILHGWNFISNPLEQQMDCEWEYKRHLQINHTLICVFKYTIPWCITNLIYTGILIISLVSRFFVQDKYKNHMPWSKNPVKSLSLIKDQTGIPVPSSLSIFVLQVKWGKIL